MTSVYVISPRKTVERLVNFANSKSTARETEVILSEDNKVKAFGRNVYWSTASVPEFNRILTEELERLPYEQSNHFLDLITEALEIINTVTGRQIDYFAIESINILDDYNTIVLEVNP